MRSVLQDRRADLGAEGETLSVVIRHYTQNPSGGDFDAC